jgi:hypothetical protein
MPRFVLAHFAGRTWQSAQTLLPGNASTSPTVDIQAFSMAEL